MIIKEATEDDIPSIIEMGYDMAKEGAFATIPFDPFVAIETVAKRISSDQGIVLLAYQDDSPVGFLMAHLSRYTFSKALFSSDDCWYVRPDKRGSRAALQLLRTFTRWSQDHSVVEIVMGVSTGVEAEKTGRLLERLGFTHIGGIYKTGG